MGCLLARPTCLISDQIMSPLITQVHFFSVLLFWNHYNIQSRYWLCLKQINLDCKKLKNTKEGKQQIITGVVPTCCSKGLPFKSCNHQLEASILARLRYQISETRPIKETGGGTLIHRYLTGSESLLTINTIFINFEALNQQ